MPKISFVGQLKWKVSIVSECNLGKGVNIAFKLQSHHKACLQHYRLNPVLSWFVVSSNLFSNLQMNKDDIHPCYYCYPFVAPTSSPSDSAVSSSPPLSHIFPPYRFFPCRRRRWPGKRRWRSMSGSWPGQGGNSNS